MWRLAGGAADCPATGADDKAVQRLLGHKVTVKVLLKPEGFGACTPYKPGDMLRKALVFTTGFPARAHVETLLRSVFEQLNNDDPQADWAKEYRSEHNRSLSVGDVVIVGERAFAVDEPVGWKPVCVEKDQIWRRAYIQTIDLTPEKMADLVQQLRAIGIEVEDDD